MGKHPRLFTDKGRGNRNDPTAFCIPEHWSKRHDATLPSIATVAASRAPRPHTALPRASTLGGGLLSLLKALEDAPQVVLLESARAGGAWNRFSFIGLGARRSIRCEPPFVVEEADGVRTSRRVNLFDFLKAEIARHRSPSFPRFGSFNGGLAGYFSYDLVNETGILRKSVRRDADVPAAFLVVQV